MGREEGGGFPDAAVEKIVSFGSTLDFVILITVEQTMCLLCC